MNCVVKKKTLGYQAVIFAALVYGSTPLLASYIYSDGCSPASLSFLRALLACPFLLWIARNSPCSAADIRRTAKCGIIAGVVDGITSLTLYTSYQFLPTSMVTTLHFIYPIFVTLGGIFVFKTKLSRTQMLCTILCMLGIFSSCTLQGGGAVVGWFLAILSGISNAVYMLCVAKMNVPESGQRYFTFFVMISSALLPGLYVICKDDLSLPSSFKGMMAVLVLAIVSGCLTTSIYQLGIRIIGAQDAAILSTFEPITSTVLGVVILHESLNIRTIIGCVLILGAVFILSVSEKYAEQKGS